MLVTNIYRILHQQTDAQIIRAALEFDAAHDVFKGHFPAMPVLPGVCMIQCIKELIESSIGKKTRLDKADMIKFLSVLNPVESPGVEAEIRIKETTDTRIVFQTSLKNNDRFLLKYSGSLLILN